MGHPPTCTLPASINPAGTITGFFQVGGGPYRGFLRTAKGTITLLDAPRSLTTVPKSINASGAITGYHQDTSGAWHGFLWMKPRD